MDPFEYDKLGFGGRLKLFRIVSFVWGCRHAGYAGQSLKTAVAFIMRMRLPMILLGPKAHLTELSFLTQTSKGGCCTVVVILCMRLFGPRWSGQKEVVYCDNDGKDEKLQQLLHEFLFCV